VLEDVVKNHEVYWLRDLSEGLPAYDDGADPSLLLSEIGVDSREIPETEPAEAPEKEAATSSDVENSTVARDAESGEPSGGDRDHRARESPATGTFG